MSKLSKTDRESFIPKKRSKDAEYLDLSNSLLLFLERLKDKNQPITFYETNEDGEEQEGKTVSITINRLDDLILEEDSNYRNYSITIDDGDNENIIFSDEGLALFLDKIASTYKTSSDDLDRIRDAAFKAVVDEDVENLATEGSSDLSYEFFSEQDSEQEMEGELSDSDLYGFSRSSIEATNPLRDPDHLEIRTRNSTSSRKSTSSLVEVTEEEKRKIQWLNYYAKSLLERESADDSGGIDVSDIQVKLETGGIDVSDIQVKLEIDVSDIQVKLEKVAEDIFITFNQKKYLLSETRLTLLDKRTFKLDFTDQTLCEMMERGRLQELSKAATHFSTLSRLSKLSGNKEPRLGKTKIFHNFEYHTELLINIAAAQNTQELIQLIDRAILQIGSPGTSSEIMESAVLAKKIRDIGNRNPVVSALKEIRRGLNGLEDAGFETYKTTSIAPYTESNLVVTIEDTSAIVHIITHAEISKFTIDLSDQTIAEEQKSSIINFIGNQIRGADTSTTDLDENITRYLTTQIEEKLRNPRREITEIKLEHDPILESLEKDFATLEKGTRNLQRNVRGGLLRKVQTQEAKLKAAFERAAVDVFGTIDQTTEPYEGLTILKEREKLTVTQPPEMRDTYKSLLRLNHANSDRVRIFEESEALRGELPTFTFKGNLLLLTDEKPNISLLHNSDGIRTFKKHELEDELEILEIFLETQRAKESEKFFAALKGFLTTDSEQLKQEYSGFVTIGNDNIKLIKTTDGVPNVKFEFDRDNQIYKVSVEEDDILTEQHLSSTIHDLQKATEALGKIKAAVQKQKIGNLFEMARVLSPYGEIVIGTIQDTGELSLTSERTENTTYSVQIGMEIYYISKDVLSDIEGKIVADPQIIESLNNYLEIATSKVAIAQAEFRTVVESVFSANTETADYSDSNYEIKPFRKIGAATAEDKVSFEATLTISRDSQSYYFKSGGVVISSNDDEAPLVKFAELVSQKGVAEDFIEAEKAVRLNAINQMTVRLVEIITQDEDGDFQTKLREATGFRINGFSIAFANAEGIEFVFNKRGENPPQPFLRTNESESTLHDLQLAQERLDEIFREAEVINLHYILEEVSKEIFGDSAIGEYQYEGHKSFISRQQDGRRTFIFQPSSGEDPQTFIFENGKLQEADPKISTETLYQTSFRLTQFALEQSSLNAEKLRATLAEITREADDGEEYIKKDYIKVNLTPEGVKKVKLTNPAKLEIPSLSYKFTDVTIQGSPFVQAGIGFGVTDLEENAPLHLIIKAQKLADQIALQIAKEKFEDAMHKMVDEKTDPEAEGSIYSYKDDNYEYKDNGDGILIFSEFGDRSVFTTTYRKLGPTTLSYNFADNSSLTEGSIAAELNGLSQNIEHAVATKRDNLNLEIASNLNSMLSGQNPEVETEAQTILREEDDNSVKFTITDRASGKQKVFKLDEDDNVLIDDKQPSIARLDDLLKEIQKSNTKDLYEKAAALVPYGQIEFTYSNGSEDVNSSLTVEKLAAGEAAPLAVIISEGDQRYYYYYLEENGLFASDDTNTKGEKITNPQITQIIKARLDLAKKALEAEQNKLRTIVGDVFRDKAPENSAYYSVTYFGSSDPYIPFRKLNNGLITYIPGEDELSFLVENETSGFDIKIKSQSGEPDSKATFLQLREACEKTSALISEEIEARIASIGGIRDALVVNIDLMTTARANGVSFGTRIPISVSFNTVRDGVELEFYFKSNGKLLTDPYTSQDSKKLYRQARLHDHQTASYDLEAILLKAHLLSELRKASNDFLGLVESGKYTRGAIFSKVRDKDEFEFGTQHSTKKIKFENSKLVEPENINNAGLIDILEELSRLRDSAQLYESQKLKEQYDALIDENGSYFAYLDIKDGRISIKENDQELGIIPPAVTCTFQEENHRKIAKVSIEGTEIENSQSICDILKAQKALEQIQQHIEEIKEQEAADRKRRSRTTGFKTTFHAVAPKTLALAELAKVSQDEIPQNKLMHALDKLFKTYVLIPTEKSKKLDKADRSTLVKHSLEILQKNPETYPDEIKRLSGYQPKSHSLNLNENLEQEAIDILLNYYATQESEKRSMITKINDFALTQKDFARRIHDKTSGFKTTDVTTPSNALSSQYAKLLKEHKELTSDSRGGGSNGL